MAATTDTTTKSFVKSLFDFQFTSLIATRFLRVVYAVWVVLLTITTVFGILAVLSQGGAGVLFALVLAVLYFFELIGLRIFMEFLIVFFQIGANVQAIRAGGIDLPRAGDLALLNVPKVPNVPNGDTADIPAPDAGAATVAPTPAGWFDAPGDPSQYRYWDGSAWTDQYSPKGGSA
jgi:hypothetical protein